MMDSSSDRGSDLGLRGEQGASNHSPAEPAEGWLGRELNILRVPDTRRIRINGVEGELFELDVLYLWERASRLPRDGVLVEIGSFMGLSSVIMATALLTNHNLGARMFCVDTWEGCPEQRDQEVIRSKRLFQVFHGNIRRAGVDCLISAIRKPSVEAARDFEPRSLDLVYVDADHSFEGVTADLNAWYPKLRQNGLMIGHDCVAPDSGVFRAVEAFAKSHGLTAFVTVPPAAHYMFELRRREVGNECVVLLNPFSTPEEALDLVGRADRLGLRGPGMCAKKGAALVMCGRLDEAVAELQEAMDLAIDLENITADLCDWVVASGLTVLAEQPRSVATHKLLTTAYLCLRRTEECERHSLEWLNLSPDCAEAYVYRGLAHVLRYQVNDAFACLNQAITLDPGCSLAYRCAGDLLSSGGLYEQAVLLYTHGLSHGPKNARVLRELGNCYLALGNHAAARTAYLEALSLRPTLGGVKDNLDAVTKALGQPT